MKYPYAAYDSAKVTTRKRGENIKKVLDGRNPRARLNGRENEQKELRQRCGFRGAR